MVYRTQIFDLWVKSPGEGMATHPSTLAENLWAEEPGVAAVPQAVSWTRLSN